MAIINLSRSEDRKDDLRGKGQSEILDTTGEAAQRHYEFTQEVTADFIYKAINSERSSEKVLLVA